MSLMTEQWVILWYQCLSENYDYSLYADARMADDLATCREYERQFEMIAEIYEDFGKLDSLYDCDATPDSHWWIEWFEPRRHLFMPRLEILSHEQRCNDPNSVVIRIPLGATLEATVAAAQELITQAYEKSDIAGANLPKYRLYEIDNKPAVKFDIVRHAVITSISKRFYKSSSDSTGTVNDVSSDFLKRHLNDMGWRISELEMNDLLQRDFISLHRQDSFRTLIGRNRKRFRMLSRNTLRASFPDKRPFKSLVWDRFQMEQTYK